MEVALSLIPLCVLWLNPDFALTSDQGGCHSHAQSFSLFPTVSRLKVHQKVLEHLSSLYPCRMASLLMEASQRPSCHIETDRGAALSPAPLPGLPPQGGPCRPRCVSTGVSPALSGPIQSKNQSSSCPPELGRCGGMPFPAHRTLTQEESVSPSDMTEEFPDPWGRKGP